MTHQYNTHNVAFVNDAPSRNSLKVHRHLIECGLVWLGESVSYYIYNNDQKIDHTQLNKNTRSKNCHCHHHRL